MKSSATGSFFLLLLTLPHATPLRAQARIEVAGPGTRSEGTHGLLDLRLEAGARGSGLQLVISGGQPGTPALVLAGAACVSVPGLLGSDVQVRPDVVVPLGSFDAGGIACMQLAPLVGALGTNAVCLQAASSGGLSSVLWLASGKPVVSDTPAPGEWCWTQQQYLASQKGGAAGPLALCAELGPCDNPVGRDAAIPTAATPIKTVRLSIHVFCEDNGASPAATLASRAPM